MVRPPPLSLCIIDNLIISVCKGEDQNHHIDPTVDQTKPPTAFCGRFHHDTTSVVVITTTSVVIIATTSVVIIATSSVVVIATTSVVVIATSSVVVIATNSVVIIITTTYMVLITTKMNIVLKAVDLCHTYED